MLQCAQQGQSCVTVLGGCCFALLRAWRVLSHVVVCSLSAVLHYGMTGECCLVLQHAQRVQSCVTPCSASAISSYRMLEECSLVLQHN